MIYVVILIVLGALTWSIYRVASRNQPIPVLKTEGRVAAETLRLLNDEAKVWTEVLQRMLLHDMDETQVSMGVVVVDSMEAVGYDRKSFLNLCDGLIPYYREVVPDIRDYHWEVYHQLLSYFGETDYNAVSSRLIEITDQQQALLIKMSTVPYDRDKGYANWKNRD